MRLRVYIKYFNPDCKIADFAKGDWIDLKAAEPVRGLKGELFYIPLGVAMDLPHGFEAIVAPRSSTPKNFGFIVPNSIGVIDNSYCGDNDQWKCPALFFGEGEVNRGDRICQFRIQLSQKATFWDKLKWLFSDGFEFIEVEQLGAVDRGGFGSTGVAGRACN